MSVTSSESALRSGRDYPDPPSEQPHLSRSRIRSLISGLAILPLGVSCLMGGFNSAFGKALDAGLVGLALFAILLFGFQISIVTRVLGRVLPWAIAALTWLLVGHFAIPIVPGFDAPRSIAPDLFVSELLGRMASFGWLVVGLLIGQRREELDMALHMLCGTLVLTLAVGLLAWFDIIALNGGGPLGWHGRFVGTIGNANLTGVVAAVALLLLVRACYGLNTQTIKFGAPIVLIAGGVSLLALMLSASRLAISGAMAAGLIVWFRRRNSGQQSKRKVAVIALVAVVMLLLTALGLFDIAFDRFVAFPAGGADRLSLWSQFADYALRSPIYGYGPGSLAEPSSGVLTDIEAALQRWNVHSAHNVVLQMVLTGGIPYAIFVIGGFVVLLRPIASIAPWGNSDLLIGAACLLLISAGFVDIALDTPVTLDLTVLLLGMFVAQRADFDLRVATPAKMSRVRHRHQSRLPA